MRSQMRTVADGVVTGLAILATVVVVVPLIAIFGYLDLQRRQLTEPGLFYQGTRSGW